MANVKGETRMALVSKGGIITPDSNQDDLYSDGVRTFKNISDVPGIENIKPGDLYDYIKKNLRRPRLAAQTADIKQIGKVVFTSDEKSDFVAAHGFKRLTRLGRGKDGITAICTRYLDSEPNKYIVKLHLKNAERYIGHTKYISAQIQNSKNVPKELIPFSCTWNLSVYPFDIFSKIEQSNWLRHFSNVCAMNAWLIGNTHCLFWDFGFTNGLNYMQAADGSTRWIDYGGSGIVHTTEVITKRWENCLTPYPDKECLVIAESDFIFCETVLHLEYWSMKFTGEQSNADLWSSIIQVRRSGMRDFRSALQNFIHTDIAKRVAQEFADNDFTRSQTWTALSEYIRTG